MKTITVGVYHRMPKAPDEISVTFRLVAYVEVCAATAEEACQQVFRDTNSIMNSFDDGPWWEKDNVSLHYCDAARSTSVGDVLLVDGIRYAIGMFDFVRLP